MTSVLRCHSSLKHLFVKHYNFVLNPPWCQHYGGSIAGILMGDAAERGGSVRWRRLTGFRTRWSADETIKRIITIGLLIGGNCGATGC
jgi:hypothetical protein